MKNTKICFVTREYAHDSMGKTGGIGVFLKNFTQHLKMHDFDITVFSFGQEPQHFNDDGVEVKKIKDFTRFNNKVKALLRWLKLPGYTTAKILLEHINRFYRSIYFSIYVLKKNFDVIEFHDYGGDIPYMMSRKIKIIRCHGSATTLHEFMGYYKRLEDVIFERKMFNNKQINVLAVSNYSAEITRKSFHLKKMPHVIYNGISIPSTKLKETYLDELTIPYSVFYCGSIRERKGIDIACRAFNDIVSKFPKASFHVMGNNNNDYWNTTAIHILSEKALEKTTYYGTVANAKVNAYLAKAHVVLFPSFGENFSIALLEAMALGKLVVASNIPSFQEIIVTSENGFLAQNDLDYYTHVNQIFSETINANKVSKNALITIQERFNIDHVIKQNINYYKSLLSL